MQNGNNKRGMSFEELRRQQLGHAKTDEQSGGDLFETDWEVFVAKYDKNTGKYDNRTFCCECAVT